MRRKRWDFVDVELKKDGFLTYGDVGVAGAALGVGGREDGVDEDEGTDDLGAESRASRVAGVNLVRPAAQRVVGVLHDPLHDAHPDDGAQALRHYVQHRPYQRHLPRQEKPEHACGAVDENEDHAAEGPSDAEQANTVALVDGVLLLVADDGSDGDVEKEQRSHELGYERSVEGPEAQLAQVQQRRRRWVRVVLRRRLLGLHANLLRHDSPTASAASLRSSNLKAQGRWSLYGGHQASREVFPVFNCSNKDCWIYVDDSSGPR
ncbi:hypothetical protein ZIOFF_061135 [Zingiber officinale]|uniref:Uncharacterized protein n=1 Tax=Zingiber officinale TaxID=94328 RepID=A0A8J5EZH5_ZINOF|nr:hypothetical protein ZIOFF_061135 [Zingiber officinale]